MVRVVGEGGGMVFPCRSRLLLKQAQVIMAVIAHLPGVQVRTLLGVGHPHRAVAAVIFAGHYALQQAVRQMTDLSVHHLARGAPALPTRGRCIRFAALKSWWNVLRLASYFQKTFFAAIS